MKVLIDAHMLGEQEGGNETYIAGLLQGFEQISTEGLQLAASYNASYPIPFLSDRIQPVKLQSSANLRRLFIEIPKVCRSVKANLLHVTYNAPLYLPCAAIVSVHDVIFHRYPEYFSPRVRLLLSTLMPLSMRRAAAVLTISEASKRDIIEHYPFVQDKIINIPLAAGPVASVKPDHLTASQYTQGQDFVLTVGTVQPRKNVLRLVRAYILLRQQGITNAKLLIVGRSMWQGSEIQKIAANSAYNQDIVFTGYLDDATVAALYHQCTVFAYPSLYEGFGLPVLEAMACGAPVITSNVSSLPEVAGDAALLVDPYSVEQIRAALEQIMVNSSLRDSLHDHWLQQAALSPRERTAQATVEIYKSVLKTKDKQQL
ncbi:glycosyltransferase family 1 protein [soil metagenome]